MNCRRYGCRPEDWLQSILVPSGPIVGNLPPSARRTWDKCRRHCDLCRRWCSYVMWAFSIVSVVFLNLATKMSSADWVVGQSLRGQLPAEEEEEEEKEEEMEGGVWTASRLPPARLDHSSAPASRGKTCPPSSLFCHSDYSNFPLFSTFPPLHFVRF